MEESESNEEQSETREFLKRLGVVAVVGALGAVTEYLIRESLAGHVPRQLGGSAPANAEEADGKRHRRQS